MYKRPGSKYVYAAGSYTGKSPVRYVCQTSAGHTNCPRRAKAKITMPKFKFMEATDEKVVD